MRDREENELPPLYSRLVPGIEPLNSHPLAQSQRGGRMAGGLSPLRATAITITVHNEEESNLISSQK